ncbi:putative RNA-directed DNA polymerase [Aphis craccivora]|uniref:Putative RNA-directed DNA polymerase n=1 Tax=Aphis craccivora TaxID=307492 RepID=A0A6G0W2S2_APHCR|nr:putative RNA-directed DNA polymerase [Aphis craccivora]
MCISLQQTNLKNHFIPNIKNHNIFYTNRQNFIRAQRWCIIKKLPKPFILLGDFNSHSEYWGSDTTDARGK